MIVCTPGKWNSGAKTANSRYFEEQRITCSVFYMKRHSVFLDFIPTALVLCMSGRQIVSLPVCFLSAMRLTTKNLEWILFTVHAISEAKLVKPGFQLIISCFQRFSRPLAFMWIYHGPRAENRNLPFTVDSNVNCCAHGNRFCCSISVLNFIKSWLPWLLSGTDSGDKHQCL